MEPLPIVTYIALCQTQIDVKDICSSDKALKLDYQLVRWLFKVPYKFEIILFNSK